MHAQVSDLALLYCWSSSQLVLSRGLPAFRLCATVTRMMSLSCINPPVPLTWPSSHIKVHPRHLGPAHLVSLTLFGPEVRQRFTDDFGGSKAPSRSLFEGGAVSTSLIQSSTPASILYIQRLDLPHSDGPS